jgi:hypothetical protein
VPVVIVKTMCLGRISGAASGASEIITPYM